MRTKLFNSCLAFILCLAVSPAMAGPIQHFRKPVAGPKEREARPMLPDGVGQVLEHSEALMLYSLDPGNVVSLDARLPADAERFHGYVVLGKTRVTSQRIRHFLISRFYQGMAENQTVRNACFEPRHALRVTRAGRTVDVVICFQCLQSQVYADGRTLRVTTSNTPRPAFDRVLAAAHVPLDANQSRVRKTSGIAHPEAPARAGR